VFPHRKNRPGAPLLFRRTRIANNLEISHIQGHETQVEPGEERGEKKTSHDDQDGDPHGQQAREAPDLEPGHGPLELPLGHGRRRPDRLRVRIALVPDTQVIHRVGRVAVGDGDGEDAGVAVGQRVFQEREMFRAHEELAAVAAPAEGQPGADGEALAEHADVRGGARKEVEDAVVVYVPGAARGLDAEPIDLRGPRRGQGRRLGVVACWDSFIADLHCSPPSLSAKQEISHFQTVSKPPLRKRYTWDRYGETRLR